MGRYKRKYNQVLSCSETPNGYWKIFVITPNDQVHHRLYIGCSRKEAIRKARRTDFDKAAGLIFNEPSR